MTFFFFLLVSFPGTEPRYRKKNRRGEDREKIRKNQFIELFFGFHRCFARIEKKMGFIDSKFQAENSKLLKFQGVLRRSHDNGNVNGEDHIFKILVSSIFLGFQMSSAPLERKMGFFQKRNSTLNSILFLIRSCADQKPEPRYRERERRRSGKILKKISVFIKVPLESKRKWVFFDRNFTLNPNSSIVWKFGGALTS